MWADFFLPYARCMNIFSRREGVEMAVNDSAASLGSFKIQPSRSCFMENNLGKKHRKKGFLDH